jgi:hypothetical protein
LLAVLALALDPSAARRDPITAMIIDPRGDELLARTLEHFVVMLPRDVPVVWLTDHAPTEGELEVLRAREPLALALRAGKLQIRSVTYNITRDEYNRRLRLPEFWLSLPQAGQVLLFERDSVLCPGASSRLRTFANVDYVGAPWKPKVPWCAHRGLSDEQCCCNSGLSLSRPPRLAQLLRHAESAPHANRFKPTNIDMYVLEYSPDLPSFSKLRASGAQRFAIETLWDGHTVPVGVHKPWFGWGAEAWAASKVQLRNLMRACPTIALLCPYARVAAENPLRDHGPPALKFVRTFCKEAPSGSVAASSGPAGRAAIATSKTSPLGIARRGLEAAVSRPSAKSERHRHWTRASKPQARTPR